MSYMSHGWVWVYGLVTVRSTWKEQGAGRDGAGRGDQRGIGAPPDKDHVRQ